MSDDELLEIYIAENIEAKQKNAADLRKRVGIGLLGAATLVVSVVALRMFMLMLLQPDE